MRDQLSADRFRFVRRVRSNASRRWGSVCMSVRSADPCHEPSPLPNRPQLLPQSSLSPCSGICRLVGPSKSPSPLLSAGLAGRKRGGFQYLAIPAYVLPDRRSSPGYLTTDMQYLGGGSPPDLGL